MPRLDDRNHVIPNFYDVNSTEKEDDINNTYYSMQKLGNNPTGDAQRENIKTPSKYSNISNAAFDKQSEYKFEQIRQTLQAHSNPDYQDASSRHIPLKPTSKTQQYFNQRPVTANF